MLNNKRIQRMEETIKELEKKVNILETSHNITLRDKEHEQDKQVIEESLKIFHSEMAKHYIECHWGEYSLTCKKGSYKESVNLRDFKSSIIHFGVHKTSEHWIQRINKIYEETKNY